MNKEDLSKIGAVARSVHVPYTLKQWVEGKSIGGEWSFDVDIAADADPELVALAVYEYVKQIAHKAMADDLKALHERPEPVRTEGLTAPEQAPAGNDDDDENKPGTFHKKEIVKFSLEKRAKDGKFELKLFPMIGNGPGLYPHVRYVADRDRMWDMLEAVAIADYDLTDLPKEYPCEWIANYQISDKKTQKGGYYKNLIKVELA